MRLRSPGTIDGAISGVQDLDRSLDLAQNSNQLFGVQDPFLTWCDDQARPQLENYFSPREAIFDELDISYNRINLGPRRTYGVLTP